MVLRAVQQVEHKNNSIKVISYDILPNYRSTAGIAKNFAYKVLTRFIDQPSFKFALLDDTVYDITNTYTGMHNKSK